MKFRRISMVMRRCKAPPQPNNFVLSYLCELKSLQRRLQKLSVCRRAVISSRYGLLARPPQRGRDSAAPAHSLFPPVGHDRNLVDPASSHTLVSKIKPCMSKYKHYTVKLRMAHYISYSLFDSPYYLDNRSNSRANTCTKQPSRVVYLLDTISPSGLDES